MKFNKKIYQKLVIMNHLNPNHHNLIKINILLKQILKLNNLNIYKILI